MTDIGKYKNEVILQMSGYKFLLTEVLLNWL